MIAPPFQADVMVWVLEGWAFIGEMSEMVKHAWRADGARHAC